MKTKLVYFLLLLGLCVACHDDVDSDYKGEWVVFGGRQISAKVEDTAGNDMLDSKHPNVIDAAKIKLFALTDSGKVQYGGDGSDFSFSVGEIRRDKTYGRAYVELVLGVHMKDGKSKDIIQWNETLADTVVCEINESERRILKVYLNGVLQYDSENPKDNYTSNKWVTFIH